MILYFLARIAAASFLWRLQPEEDIANSRKMLLIILVDFMLLSNLKYLFLRFENTLTTYNYENDTI
jgi:hypothetical protein